MTQRAAIEAPDAREDPLDPLSPGPELVCPACHVPLVAGASKSSCPACKASYPSCAGLPILVREPERIIAAAQTSVRQSFAHLRWLESSIAKSPWNVAGRQGLRERVMAGLELNRRFLQRIGRLLPTELVVEPEITVIDALYQSFETVLRYAVRDWSGDPSDEEQVKTIASSIVRALPDTLAKDGTSLVLGVGTCRLAVQTTSVFRHVIACDLSLPMLLTYIALREAPQNVAEINFINAETSSRQVRTVSLSTDRPAVGEPPRPEQLTLLVADGTRLPLAARSVTAVFSIYFTDVVPLSNLLPEVQRVLDEGGLFIHFGTLGYCRSDPSEMLSVEDVRQAFEAAGFVIETERWVSTRDIGARPDRLVTVLLRNWLFVARRGARGDPAQSEPGSPI